VPIEGVDHAAREMLKLGAEVEVLEPRELREKMIEVVKRMATLYAHRRPSGRRRRRWSGSTRTPRRRSRSRPGRR
jgi:hypothetical protein